MLVNICNFKTKQFIFYPWGIVIIVPPLKVVNVCKLQVVSMLVVKIIVPTFTSAISPLRFKSTTFFTTYNV